MADFRLPNRLRRAIATLAPVIVTDEVTRLGITEDVVDGVESFLAAVPVHIRLALLAGIQAFDSSARAVPSSFGRAFHSLPAAKAKAHFERWYHGPEATHQLARGIKVFVSFAYYEHPLVRERIGYLPDPWIEQVSAQRLEKFGEVIAAHEAMLIADDPLDLARREVQA
jgi:hypothetical protein